MNGRKGLTIIEVLIAITIIGIVFVALASLQVSSLQVTRGADQESQLLQEAVTEFEKLRTVVLENFRAYFLGCTNEAHVCPVGTPMVGETINSFYYVITRVYPATDGSGGLVPTPSGEPVDGLLRVTITAERFDRTVSFGQYVTCLDANQAPTISDRSSCLAL